MLVTENLRHPFSVNNRDGNRSRREDMLCEKAHSAQSAGFPWSLPLLTVLKHVAVSPGPLELHWVGEKIMYLAPGRFNLSFLQKKLQLSSSQTVMLLGASWRITTDDFPVLNTAVYLSEDMLLIHSDQT